MEVHEVDVTPDMLDEVGRVKLWSNPDCAFILRAPVDAREMVTLGIGVIVDHGCDTPPAEVKTEPEPVPVLVQAQPKPKRGRPRKVVADAPKGTDAGL